MVSRKKFYVKILFCTILFSIIAMLVVTLPVYNAADKAFKKQFGNKCKGIATAVAALIEEDIESYVQFITTLDQDSEYYQKTKAILENIKLAKKNSIEFLYTEIRVSDTEIMYVLNAEPAHSDTFLPPGLLAPLTKTRLLAYETKELVAGDFVTTQKGTLLSAYAPIYNRKTGEFVGLVGTAVSIRHYNEFMDYQLFIIITSAVILMLMIIVAFLVSTGWLEKMLITDSLTNTFNRRFFEHELKARIEISKKTGVPLFIFMIDLDNFKKINDKYGHSFGDKALTLTSKTMQSVLRDADCLARYGGEEFAICLSGIDAEKAAVIANRMREAIEAAPIYNNEQNEYACITISVGVAQYIGQSLAQLIENADKALYDAKTMKNTVVLFG